ncbi:ABC bile acid transporter protein [Rutstroemia sp. NJR-2017a BBW]|nr:ABC bile acid transporter protein [Rutstroemia sp. NJR-2017a BBW]
MDSSLKQLSYATPALIGVFTLPSVWRYIRSFKQAKPTNKDGIYEDKDGSATEASMAKYSTKQQFVVIFTSLAVGLALSFALAVFATVRKNAGFSDLCVSQLWLLFTSWILTLLQILETSRETQPVVKFQRGIFNSVSCVLIAALGLIVLSNPLPHAASDRLVFAVLDGVQVLAAVISTVAFFFVQRRPDVFTPDGTIVERQFQKSLWSRYAFDWSRELLDLASERLIEVADLPAMDAHVRSKDVKEYFQSIALKPTVSLWLQVFWAWRVQILTQWVLGIISAVIDAGPQFAVLKLLQYLEARQGFDAIDPKAWTWVAGLFAATIAETLMDNRINWLMWSDIAIPIRSALTSLIFEKMLRMKDCKEPPKRDPEEETAKSKDTSKLNGAVNGHANADDTAKQNTPNNPENKPKDKKKGDADAKKKLETEKDIINMFAVDANQVGVFGAVNQFYVMFFSKFVVSVVFLWLLVGWQSLSAGMLAIILMAPINQYLTKRYGSYQKELMMARDKKTSIITEALNGIRQIKFSATEPQWMEKINEAREEELTKLWKTRINNLYMTIGSNVAPVLLTVLSLATYSYIQGDLLPSVAFTALGVFMQLEGVLGMVPFLFMMGINAKVSCDRIDTFLRSPEKPENTYPGESITFDKVSVSFPSKSEVVEDERFVLRDLTLSFPNNALSVISGPTGSGKSLLLSAILGEVEVLSGNITVPRPIPVNERHDDKATAANWVIPSAIAFVSQTPWIENATIKDNILFGLPFDATRYQKVLDACALTKDLHVFDDGDLTEVGAQGISLSGGQKWRLTLARAFYSRAGILILDDVFSALDAHVGKEIYDNALMGELSEGRTRILVTHHVSLCLPRAKYAVQLSKNGALEHAGSIDDLREAGELDEIMKTEQEGHANEEEANESTTENGQAVDTNGQTSPDKATSKKPKKLVEDEKRETGSVKASVYTAYLKATGGIPFWAMVVLFYLFAEGLIVGRSWWIKIWTSSYEHTEKSPDHFNSTHLAHLHAYTIQQQLRPSVIMSKFENPFSKNHTLGYYLLGYVIISTFSVFVATARFYLIYRGSLSASRSVFKKMTDMVLRTPLRWLDTVPTGRILNRFTADFSAMDSQLSSNFAQTASAFLEIIGIMVSAFFVSPYIIIISVILLTICVFIANTYIKGARSLKRLESIQKSPMISHFGSALAGLSTIRAFSNGPVFEEKMHKLVDAFGSATWHNWLFNRWFGLRMALVGSFFSSSVAAFIVSTNGVDASLAGFALAFALSYRRAVIHTIRLLAQAELDMNAAERIFEYTELETEPQTGRDNIRASWPEEGKIEVTDLEVGYAEGLPAILKGLTFTVEKNQRVGIVGRTGAALFRFLEARAGSIIIDGIDISTIKLHDLRTRLSIIPQDPVLFSGTIRSNLDPFDEFSDQQIREALERVHLIPSNTSTPVPEPNLSLNPGESSTATETSSVTAVAKENTNIFLSLQSPISSAGANLSQGQKQLLCLARAILSRPKVLLLDEATSAVDMDTDALIQRSIREEFANTTLLVVAHRLSTVADFDRILVMKDGVAAEFGGPRELVEREDGVFKSMVDMSGEREELIGTIRGAGQ